MKKRKDKKIKQTKKVATSMQANIKVTKVLEFYDQATHNKQYNKNDITTGKSYFLYELL